MTRVEGRGSNAVRGWRFSRRERAWLIVGVVAILVFGANLEKRTALRRVPMTDLGVFCTASWAAIHGENLYNATDWHGWHYQYPPTLAILFAPLAHAPPAPLPPLAAGEPRTALNTPWGYDIDSGRHFYGLHEASVRFFWIVAVWYFLSVVFVFGSAHLLACALEGQGWRAPPAAETRARSRWWKLRLLPLLVCAGSIGTDFSRGQVDVLMLAAVSFGLYLAARNRELSAGLCLSFPATVKLFPPFLLLYPFWRGRWKMMAGVAAGLLLALAALPALALGPNRTVELYRNWVDVLAKPALGRGSDTSRAKELTGMSSTDNQSLLAAIHNWRYLSIPRDQRPQAAAPWERSAAYAVGGLMLVGIGLVSGLRRQDSAQALLILAGLLIGLAFVVSPIVHNYYYLLMLPLVAALLDLGMQCEPCLSSSTSSSASASAVSTHSTNWKLLVPVIVFMVVDLSARLPGIGPRLRDLGLPLLSMVALLCAGAVAVLMQSKKEFNHG